MKVRIAYTTEVPDEYRRAINHYFGEPGLATREVVKDWYENHGNYGDHLLGEIIMQMETDESEREA